MKTPVEMMKEMIGVQRMALDRQIMVLIVIEVEIVVVVVAVGEQNELLPITLPKQSERSQWKFENFDEWMRKETIAILVETPLHTLGIAFEMVTMLVMMRYAMRLGTTN